MPYDLMMKLSNPLKIAIIACSLMLCLSLVIFNVKKLPLITITVMTFNIENGGTQVDLNKIVEAIQEANADVVGIQEAWGNTAKLAHALGWRYYDQRQHIISRLPLLKPASVKGLYTFVEVMPGKIIAIANVHLPDEPYGPDLIRQGATKEQVEANERKVRLPTALPFINKLAALTQRGIPVFLTGDFNSPSHLDWKKRKIKVEWPVTKTLADKGFTDAYRSMYPDTIQQTSATWPAKRPDVVNSHDHFNPTQNDPPDRIDFIFSAGPVRVIASDIVGENEFKGSDLSVSPWPSDHRAVIARFAVLPAKAPEKGLILSPSRIPITAAPALSVTPTSVRPGQTFTVTWKNSPGNRYDYILIAPAGSNHIAWEEAVRLYTDGEGSGSIQYNEQTSKGNWLAWHASNDAKWPLTPNTYDIKLMLDDGYTELAATQIVVK
jgi:endonuclease/exonuclease/phosphatase family metal-dependent hydrolase